MCARLSKSCGRVFHKRGNRLTSDYRMREIIFDTETTGFDPATGDRMVEIGCIEMVSRVMTGQHYHAYFNLGFLNHELQFCGRPPVSMDRMVDTVALARVKNPGAKLSLDALCTRYGIDRSHRIKHGALLDAELLAQLYIELTGGRQIGLGLADNDISDRAMTQIDASSVQTTKVFRPARAHGASEAELARHAEFIAKIKDALWLQTGSAL